MGLKTAICTISSQSHWFKARALFESLNDKTGADFYCLITDANSQHFQDDRMQVMFIDDFSSSVSVSLRNRYKGNKLRWAHKPILLSYLLNQGYDAVIYVDNDICFFSSPDFLFDLLKDKSILLSPHFYPASPLKNQIWLEANFKTGLYNAGFVGVSSKALNAMDWWASSCNYTMKKSYRRGLFDDQKYLDLFPVLFDDVEILKHRGCNVAGWNIDSSPRTIDEMGHIRIHASWPLVFVHFNYYTMQCILDGRDALLIPCWNIYHAMLVKYNPSYHFKKELKPIYHFLRAYRDYALFRFNRLFD